MIPEKRPRQYAFEMIRIKDLEGRRKYLETVPDEYVEMVKSHVLCWWPRRRLI